MSEQNPNDINIAQLSAGARIRAIADGELGAEHLGAPDGAEGRLAFERSLRESVARSMGGVRAPEDLRARVRAILAGEDATTSEPPADVIRTPLADTRNRSFWSRVGAGPLVAVAAIVAVALGAVFLAPHNPNATPPAHTLQAGLLASFLQGQHHRCQVEPEYATQKFTAMDEPSAIALARDHLGQVPRLLQRGFKNLEGLGYRFAGMGRCSVPGDGPSVHVAFRDAGARMVSLFIQVDTNQWILADAHAALIHEGLDEGQVVVVWRESDHFLYLLFAGSSEDLAAFRREFGVPSDEAELIPAP